MQKNKNMLKLKVLSGLGIIAFCAFFVITEAYGVEVKLKNPLGTVTKPDRLIGKILKTVLSFVGSIALLMFMYGGLTWMLSGGNPEKVKKGRETFIWATLGLLVIFSSFLIVKFIFSTII